MKYYLYLCCSIESVARELNIDLVKVVTDSWCPAIPAGDTALSTSTDTTPAALSTSTDTTPAALSTSTGTTPAGQWSSIAIRIVFIVDYPVHTKSPQ